MTTSSKTSPPSTISGENVQTEPTFTGILETTLDALILFEAARRGVVPRVCRRLAEDERSVIKSGSIFIFEEQESGIKRWTDGLIWSPSRISGNYLIYRQTDVREARSARTKGTSAEASKTNLFPAVDFPMNESLSSAHASANPTSRPQSRYSQITKADKTRRPSSSSSNAHKDGESEEVGMYADMLGGIELARAKEKQLIGSLSNSYCAKPGGLVKKTMALNIDGRTHHLISYYSVSDGMAQKFRTPSSVPEILALGLSPDLLAKEQLRFAPQTELGLDGTLRYVAEADMTSPTSGLSFSAPSHLSKVSSTNPKDQLPKNRQVGFMPLPPVSYQSYPVPRPSRSAQEPNIAAWSSSLPEGDSLRRGSISKILSETQLNSNSNPNPNPNPYRSHRDTPNSWPVRSLPGDAIVSAGHRRSSVRLPSSPDGNWKHRSSQAAKIHHHPYAPSSPTTLDNGGHLSFSSGRSSPAVHPGVKKRSGYPEMTVEPAVFAEGPLQEYSAIHSSSVQNEPIWITKRESVSAKGQSVSEPQTYQESSLHQYHHHNYQHASTVAPPAALSTTYPLPILPGNTDESAFLFEPPSLVNGPASFGQQHQHWQQQNGIGPLFSSQGETEYRRQSTCPSLSSISVGTTLPSDSPFSPVDPPLFYSDPPAFHHQSNQLYQPSWGLGLNSGELTTDAGTVPYALPSSSEYSTLDGHMPASSLVAARQPLTSHSHHSQHPNLLFDSPPPIQNEILSTCSHVYPPPPSYNSESPLRSYQSSVGMAHSYSMDSPVKFGLDSFTHSSLLLGPEAGADTDDQGFDQVEFLGYEQIQKGQMKTSLSTSTLEGSEGTEITIESGVWAQ
ncbi:Gluconate transport-inducing protein [Phaffia rhodozyma]|uniref:Gluconate transport-inducing protein n=1 Tax=Phaffia rhodozyma TaxID=264483 RepID=A0A0F7SG44_PHARH|nr:Gluconate transport-inducing protein [Phaffia rhodozyma]